MIERELRQLAEQSYIAPSPGELGAFRCAMCGSSRIGLVVLPTLARIVCADCGNFLEFARSEEASGG